MRLRLKKNLSFVSPAILIGMAFLPAAAQVPAIPPVQLVRETVQNELASNSSGPRYMFCDHKKGPHGSQTKLMVETSQGMAGMIIAEDDHPLSAAEKQSEEARIQRFIDNPDELSRKQKQEKEDSDRVTRIMKALPDAFLYQYDGTIPGTPAIGKLGHELIRLKFTPNPNYDPPSRVEQVLTEMSGIVLIDAVEHRIAQIDGILVGDVSFGWGLFGHLDRGGHFFVQQADVGDDHWEITRMDLSFTGKILLFKSLNIKSTEVSSDFQRVPSNLTFAEGVQLLKKEEARLVPESNRGQHSSEAAVARRSGS